MSAEMPLTGDDSIVEAAGTTGDMERQLAASEAPEPTMDPLFPAMDEMVTASDARPQQEWADADAAEVPSEGLVPVTGNEAAGSGVKQKPGIVEAIEAHPEKEPAREATEESAEGLDWEADVEDPVSGMAGELTEPWHEAMSGTEALPVAEVEEQARPDSEEGLTDLAAGEPWIVLINPPSARGTTANREGSGGLGVQTAGSGGFFYPPQTLATVAAVLRGAGHQVLAWDCVAERLSSGAVLKRLGGLPGSGFVGVMVAAATRQADKRFVDTLARTLPNVTIFLCGPGLRHVWREMLQESAAHLAVLREAEWGVPALVEALTSSRPEAALAALDGVAYWEEGEIIHRPAGAMVGDLDELPHPAWDLLPNGGYPFLTLSGSRGCDHGCAYCPYVVAQGAFRPRAPELVAAEARWLARTFGKPRLVFRDPAFAADRERTVELCRALRKARVRAGWECESRPEHFDPDLLYLMRRARCQVVKLGLETVDDGMLWGTGRLLPGWTAARYRAHVAELVATCRRLRLNCRVFVMTGLPGETVDALETTLAFLRAVRPPAVSVKRYHPYRGTPLGEGQGDVVGHPVLTEAELLAIEEAMRGTAEPLPPRQRSLLRRLVKRPGRR
jgi:radical SAM superfamily enzyme YgiQ (UPF0313 family)